MKKIFLYMYVIFLLANCKNPPDKTIISDSHSTGKAVSIIDRNGSGVTCCNYSAVNKDTMDFSLSTLVDSFQVVKLESSRDAYSRYPQTIISNNYIGVRSSKNPFKLFDHSGKFIRNIGSIGRGPGEYNAVYSEIIDEKNNRIYLLPWPNQQILAFDTLGNNLPPVKLCFGIAKATVYLDQNVFTIFNLPFGENQAIAFQQTETGELIQDIKAGKLAQSPDFSNEIYSFHYSGDFSFYLFNFFNRTNDTLYHYNVTKNIMKPKFTMYFGDKDIPLHTFYELPEYYLAVIGETARNWRGTTIVTRNHPILVDKQKLTAKYIRFRNDFFGGLNVSMEHLSFRNEMCIINIDALSLKKEIENSLKNNKNLTSEMREKLIQFNENLNKEDNNIIFYGKLKQSSKSLM